MHSRLISDYVYRLMGTSFFNESHFGGLLAELKVKARQHAAARVAQDMLHKLSSQKQPEPYSTIAVSCSTAIIDRNMSVADSSTDTSSTPSNIDTSPSSTSSSSDDVPSSTVVPHCDGVNVPPNQNMRPQVCNPTVAVPSGGNASIQPVEDATLLPNHCTASHQTNKSIKCHKQKESSNMADRKDSVQVSSSGHRTEDRDSDLSICARLFALLRRQLLKAHEEVTKRFGVKEQFLTSKDEGEGKEIKTKTASNENEKLLEVSIQESEPERCSGHVSSTQCDGEHII